MEDSATHEKKQVIEELHGFIRVYSDGSVERPDFPGVHVPACSDFVGGVASEDVTINTYTGVSARIHLPQSVASSDQGTAPIVLHFHSGGFCTGSTDGAIIHAFCSRMALQSKSIWVSVNYRLAPEHRLPAAYDDAYTSFMWLHTQAVMADGGTHHSQHDESSLPDQPHDAPKANSWLGKHADYSRCFLAGESAGGAIIHYLVMRISHCANWSSHIQIRGLLMIHPTFAIGDWITAAFDPRKELRSATMRRLSLPDGAELDHPLVNPLHAAAPSLKDAIIPPCQIAVADQDERYAAAMHYLHVMKECGHPVQVYATEGKGHCFYLRDPRCKESELLVEELVAFICEK